MRVPTRAFTRRGFAVAATATGLVASHAAVGLFFASHDPYHTTVFPPCVILSVTGWQCPGCGGTRSLYSLFHGDLVASIQLNPLVPTSYVAGVLLVGAVTANSLARPGLARVLSATAIGLIAIVGLYVAVIRNVLPS